MKIKPNYKPIRLIFYYSLGFYKDGVIQFYKGGLTDNILKRLYDLRSYVQKRGIPSISRATRTYSLAGRVPRSSRINC